MSQSVTFNLVLQVTISIGEPQVQHILNPNRRCARCAAGYNETASIWPMYPMCPRCEEESHAEDYQRELEANRIERARHQQNINAIGNQNLGRNTQQDVNWRNEGF